MTGGALQANGRAAAGAVAEPRELGLDRAVPRELVHKAAIEQVLLTDSIRLDEDRFLIAGQLPRAHALFSDFVRPRYDTLMLLEAARQSAELTAHEYLGVPLGSPFVFGAIRFGAVELAAFEVRDEPARLDVQMTLENPRYRRGLLASGKPSGLLTIDGVKAIRMSGTYHVMRPEIWARLRGERARLAGREGERVAPPSLPDPLPPERVGRRDARNVVISELRPGDGATEATVIPDPGHLSFFDHPLDHVPAMLLLEALRQTAVATAAAETGRDAADALLTRCEVSFGSFAEVGAALVSRARPGATVQGASAERIPLEVGLVQNGERLGGGMVEIAFAD